MVIGLLGSWRLHIGAPRDRLFAVIGLPTEDRSGRELSTRPTREITWMYGVSWRAGGGWVFLGAQRHLKQKGET